MAEPAIKAANEGPPGAGPVIDREHFSRMTFGDRALERELLGLFDKQAVLLLERMRTADRGTLSALAHTLKGSALGIGAMQVAEAAAVVERASSPAAIERLQATVAAARAEIAALLNNG